MNSRAYIVNEFHHLPPLDQLEDYLNKELDILIECVFPVNHPATSEDKGLEFLSPLPLFNT